MTTENTVAKATNLNRICDVVARNGYKNLSDEEINTYIEFKQEAAKRDEAFQASLTALKDKAAAEIAEIKKDHEQSRANFDALLNKPLEIKTV